MQGHMGLHYGYLGGKIVAAANILFGPEILNISDIITHRILMSFFRSMKDTEGADRIK